MSDAPTPEVDHIEKTFPDMPVSGWKRVARRFECERNVAKHEHTSQCYQTAQAILLQKAAEIELEDLRRWKAEMLSVMLIRDKILPELVRRREEIERLRREIVTTTVEGDETSTYLIETRTTRLKKYNPKFGDERECECGHPYYRHFDWGDEDSGCSCKYCGCNDFLEVDPDPAPE